MRHNSNDEDDEQYLSRGSSTVSAAGLRKVASCMSLTCQHVSDSFGDQEHRELCVLDDYDYGYGAVLVGSKAVRKERQ